MALGLVTAQDARARRREFVCRVDGVDVTRECAEAHDGEGWAVCFLRGPDGHFYADGNEVAKTTRRGVVTFWRRFSGFEVRL